MLPQTFKEIIKENAIGLRMYVHGGDLYSREIKVCGKLRASEERR